MLNNDFVITFGFNRFLVFYFFSRLHVFTYSRFHVICRAGKDMTTTKLTTIQCRVIVKLFAVWFLCCGFSGQNFFWQRMPDGINESRIRNTIVLDDDAQSVIVVTDKGVYHTSFHNSAFQRILTFPVGGQRVYSIYAQQNWIAIATQQGLWESHDLGKNWERTFNPAHALHRRCYGVFKSGDIVFVGTAQGLFRKDAAESTWYRHKGELGREPVFDIVGNDEGIFVATSSGVYYEGKSGLGTRDSVFGVLVPSPESRVSNFDSQKIFSVTGNTYDINSSSGSSASSDTDIIYDNRFIRAITVDGSALFVSTKSGLWRMDYGEWSGEKAEWETQRISSVGVPLSDVNDLKILSTIKTSHGQWASENPNEINRAEPGPVLSINQSTESARFRTLLIASSQGVFIFQQDQWVSLYQGLSTNMVNDLFVDAQGDVYASTDMGVFKSSGLGLGIRGSFFDSQAPILDSRIPSIDSRIPSPDLINYQEIKAKFFHEPTVQDVQGMVINYADVDKQKIDTWKNQARAKAFVPSVSLDFDRDVSDLYHWNTGANPDELQRGTSVIDWGISFRWDLADALWSTDQTTIDSRAKMMVELRDDLLNQVTRMYFERRRLQIEILQMQEHDPLRWQKEMRVEELTAGMDALTGGQFSRDINK